MTWCCVACVCGAGLSVRELTGDMQLSKKELAETQARAGLRCSPFLHRPRPCLAMRALTWRVPAALQMIVTTPEKWDVITRKGGEVSCGAPAGASPPPRLAFPCPPHLSCMLTLTL